MSTTLTTDLSAELSALRRAVKTAAASPFMPAPAGAAIAQACGVIGLLATEVASMRQLLEAHLEAHLAMGH